MDQHHFIESVIFIGAFLAAIGILQFVTKKISFPFTVALLLAGFVTQFASHFFHIGGILTLSPDIIFFVLLPILLFEASLHINIHEFKRQFKTITFLATFGLLVSIFVVGVALAFFLGMPLPVALLFGALISATDPIAVLALFKSLGAPKRLALLADGESMFNDATAVIAFRVISTCAVAQTAFRPLTLVESTAQFLYVFIGSIILGAIIGFVSSWLFERLKVDRILLASVTTGVAIFSFAGAEHFFHLSGVITTVIAGVIVGNIGRRRVSGEVMHYIEEFWEYAGFFALSLVFFFAAYQLDLSLFQSQLPSLAFVIFVVLVARAISVYLTAYLSNKLPFFNDEPNIPMSWQHILNWGGLRGVIPLVLVYSLPDNFAFKETFLQFTFATLLFTLFVNGLTIKSLLVKLKLHLPRKEEQIIADELALFEIDEKRQKLNQLSSKEFSSTVISHMEKELKIQESKYKNELLSLSTPEEFLTSLKLQALSIERASLRKLFEQGRFTEVVFHEFESELDIQQDALEYPGLHGMRTIGREGMINAGASFRKKVFKLRKFATSFGWLSRFLDLTEDSIIRDRYGLLRARLFTSFAVLDYLDRVEKIMTGKELKKAIDVVRSMQKKFIASNNSEVVELEKKYPHIALTYQQKTIQTLIR
ncbi:MAG: Sodium:proton antiporter [Patescibacteria group bacterium]|nr:Sodium:proton antiporter [Patescibacteria group bacterium]